MKRLLVFLICISVFLCSCSSDTTTSMDTASDSAPKTEETQEPRSEFYEMSHNSNRPIAVMIDNDNEAARPQIGLEHAYLIYEIIVEGGASRMMALFKDYDVEKVGPVRSARHYFLDYALENDAIYAHAGWSPQAQNDIAKLKINNINGILGNDGTNYWRDYTYDKTYHNLYTSVAKLSQYAKENKKYCVKTSGDHINMHTKDTFPSGEDCLGVSFRYSAMYGVGFSYNSEKGVYERSVNGKPHRSQTGETLSAKNIIVYNVANYDLNDGQNKGRQDIKNLGTGSGWYISLGKKEPITWTKDARNEKTLYLRPDGTELKVNPGITFIQIVPENNEISFN